eukprot:SAG11_NODE_1562_length_4676_cov_2.366616_1_plen_153_part_00
MRFSARLVDELLEDRARFKAAPSTKQYRNKMTYTLDESLQVLPLNCARTHGVIHVVFFGVCAVVLLCCCLRLCVVVVVVAVVVLLFVLFLLVTLQMVLTVLQRVKEASTLALLPWLLQLSLSPLGVPDVNALAGWVAQWLRAHSTMPVNSDH